jgi:hypothetical protein
VYSNGDKNEDEVKQDQDPVRTDRMSITTSSSGASVARSSVVVPAVVLMDAAVREFPVWVAVVRWS